MPKEDTGTDLSEVQSQLDTEQMDYAERMSKMQDAVMGHPQNEEETEEPEVTPEQAYYRVIMADFGCVENDTHFIDYFSDYYNANAVFDSLCDDTEFIKYHDKPSVTVELQKAYRGLSQVFWETIRKPIVYDTTSVPKKTY